MKINTPIIIVSLLFTFLLSSCDNSTTENEVVDIDISKEEIMSLYKDFKTGPLFAIESIELDTAIGKRHLLIRLDSAEVKEKHRQSKVIMDAIEFREEWLASGKLSSGDSLEYLRQLEEYKQIVKSINEGGKHLKSTERIKIIQKRRAELTPDSVNVTRAIFKVNLQEKEGDPFKEMYFVKARETAKNKDVVFPIGKDKESARSFLLDKAIY